MWIDSRAEAISTWKSSRARVERPADGVLFTTMPTPPPAGSGRNRLGPGGEKSAGGGRRKPRLRQPLAGRLQPVLGEGGLQAFHQIAPQADHRVAPWLAAVRRADPEVGHADAAHERYLAVDHQDVAVRAVVEA